MSSKIMNLIIALKCKCVLTDEEIRNKTPLSQSEYKGILTIGSGEELTAAEYSERMGLSASRGSRVIEKMIQSGYLKSERSGNDRRCVVVRLSSKGEKVKSGIERMMSECNKKIMAQLTDEEIKCVEKALTRLIEVI